MKTNKFATKRLRLTKKGKIVFRTAGQNHFDAKESSNTTRRKRHSKVLPSSEAKIFKQILS